MKETTREMILKASLQLFNEKGYYIVSLRQIASEIGISQGNLTYHFKKKEEILNELHQLSVVKLSYEFTEAAKLGPNFYFLFELARKTYQIQQEFRFFIADRIYLLQPEFLKYYQSAKTERVSQFNQMFDAFITKGYMRSSEFQGEYEELGLRLFLLGIYSMLDLEIEYNKDTVKAVRKYLTIINTCYYPYLTQKGKEKYNHAWADYKLWMVKGA
jgi:AcrR family transcriptional regulator